ncbi:unnamed protein product [Enterobius vermicularis]|uniref:G_PROTEIN_RECEP_F3_4 domain-containing protein n=1 Tax=Enterobius vermicularis TaxID=51028 RepID=A0A0N4V3F7_ENTVE|nr:unnamed protein product [Enterobius vermicularis]
MGFECGQVDLNAFVRLGALIDALERVNKGKVLQDVGLSIGAIVVDSCSSDLRTVADLYELFFGTNIEKLQKNTKLISVTYRSELIGLIRDDSTYLPNVDDFSRYLRIPTINTFFSPEERPMTTGMLPTEEMLVEAILSLIRYTHSTCVSAVFDDSHASTAKMLVIHAERKFICVDGQVHITGQSSVDVAQTAIRKLLLTQARFVLAFVNDGTWLDILQALRNEMVIAGRFVFVVPQSERWTTSLKFADAWPHFDQLLLTVTNKRLTNQNFVNHLTQRFPSLPFPQHWLRQFWMTAFKCHIEGENLPGKKFSRPCSNRQTLSLTSVVPDLNLEPITLAVHSMAVSLRQLVDRVCPGALLKTLSDCVNDPFPALFRSIKSSGFNHFISTEPDVYINSTTGFRDAEVIINRVRISSQEIQFEEVANWDIHRGLRYVAPNDLFLEERDGSRQRVHSSCPRSACALRFAYQKQASSIPSFRSGLNDLSTMIFAGFSILWMFICLMCVYQQLISRTEDLYRVCTMVMFVGLAFLSFISVFFIMVPSSITCAVRSTCLSIALSSVFSPILVKSVLSWRREMILSNLQSARSGNAHSSTMFWLSAIGIFFQVVVVAEWMFFESPISLTFSTFAEESMWRCAPGQKYEQRLFYSLILVAMMVVTTVVTSLITAKNMDSRQNILVSIIAALFGISLYLVLPLLRYSIRDKVFSSGKFSFLGIPNREVEGYD